MLAIFMLLFLVFDTSNSFPTLNYTISNCYESSNTYPLNSSYETNLNNLLPTLVSQISTTKHGFLTNKQQGSSDNQDPAYGLALCRGDVNPDNCRNCVEIASKEIITGCPRAREAVIWKEQCMLRYSNESFFSLLQENPYQVLYNYDKATDDADSWMKLVKDTLSDVASKAAASDESGNKFATKQTYVSSLQKYLYTLAQCAPDLTTEDCSKCFVVASSRLQVWFSHRGGILLAPSCAVRFEVYVFYNNSSEWQIGHSSMGTHI